MRMKGDSVLYQGRLVEKKEFRAFVYSREGNTKLAESWEDFLNLIATGIWYASIEDAEKIEFLATSVRKREEIPFKVSNKKRRNA